MLCLSFGKIFIMWNFVVWHLKTNISDILQIICLPAFQCFLNLWVYGLETTFVHLCTAFQCKLKYVTYFFSCHMFVN